VDLGQSALLSEVRCQRRHRSRADLGGRDPESGCDDGARVVEGRLFYCTRDGAFGDRVVRIDDGARDVGRHVLASVDEAITRGFLPAAPRPQAGTRPGACGICDFLAVCGPDEEKRSLRKDRNALSALQRLRGLA